MSPAINPTQVDMHKLGYYLLTEPVHDLTGLVMKKINKVQPMVPNHE